MEILCEIDFDSGTRYYSRVAFRTPTAEYKARVLAFGGIQREIGLIPGDYRAASVSLTLSNVSGEFSALRSTEPWRNRLVRVMVINPDEGLGSLYTAFIGRIDTWSMDKEQCEISAVDWIQSRLLRPVSGVIDIATYPDLPDETPRALIPLVIGEVTSPGGALPAYLVDPDVVATGWRYVMAQGRVPEPDEVYAYGVLVDPGDYTINYDDGPGGIECTYIDFTADPRTADTANPHVSWNGSGITDDQTETGGAVTNGAEQLAQFLRLNGFAANDLDLNTITDAAAELVSSGVTGGFAAVDQDQTIGDVVRQFAESYNLQVFTTQTGLVGMAAPVILVGEAEVVPEVTALLDIVRGSFATGGREEVASSLVAPYAQNFFTGEFTATRTITNSRQITALGEDVVLRQEFPFIRTEAAMNAAAAVKMFFLRESRQAVQSIVPPHWYREFDIGSTIRLTHFAAPGDAEQDEDEDHQTADLVALYRMDEGTAQVLGDTSGSANHGELGSTSGADADDPAWIAEGLSFDGVDDLATAPFLVDPDASDFTAWVIFRASAAGARRVILRQEDGTGTGRIWLEVSALNFIATSIGGTVNAHSVELEAGRWYAATLRKLGTTVSLFLEGGDKEDFTETAEASNGSMVIGYADIDPLHLQGILGDDLLAWFRFDEGSGQVLTDYSLNGNDGELGSTSGSDANDPAWVHDGLDFATDDYVTAPNILSPSATSFTVLAAVNVTAASIVRGIIGQEDGTGTGAQWLYIESTAHRLSANIGGFANHTATLTAGWHVVAMRKSGTTISLFVDGGDKEDFTRTAVACDGGVLIGTNKGFDWDYDDNIALIAVYDAALTDQQVADNSAAMQQILDDRIAEEPIPNHGPFDDRMALVAVYDDAMSDTAVASNTVSLKRIVNDKVAARGLYRVLGSGLISVGPSLAVQLRAADLTQESIIDLFVPPVPESLALSDGSSLVTAALSGTFVLAGTSAGASVVTADLSQRYVALSLQHLWPFYEGSGQVINDVVSTADGELGDTSGAEDEDPIWNDGLQFDGAEDIASIPFFQNPGSSSDWTFLLVFKATAEPAVGSFASFQGGMMGQEHSSDAIRWLQHFVTTGSISQLRLPICNPSSPFVVGNFSLNTWYAVFLRRTGSPSSLRANLMRTGSDTNQNYTGVVQSGDQECYLGFNGPSFNPGAEGYWPGYMAWMMHWNRRLSDSEVTDQFAGVKAALAPRGISL